MRRLILYVAVSGLLAAAAGCSHPAPWRGGERVVLAVQTGITDGYTLNRDEINDEGVPPLRNLTGHPVRLVSVQWVNQPTAAHVDSVDAYTYAAVGHGFISGEGNLPVACANQYRPSPVTAAVIPPHAASRWFVVIAFTISKVGTYRMERFKIGYVTDGHKGWQYQNIDTTLKVVNPPLPGPVPIPRSGICG
jgi:hypothetical protein